MKNRFSIGEMSRLHNVPIKTLRYYDQIGLFKPVEVDDHSRYRYYSTEQFEQLNTINYLKFLGLSLKEIKNHLENRDVNYFLQLLRKQKEITENKIKELELINNRFTNRITEIEEALKINDLEVAKIKKIPKRRILSLEENIYSEPEWELALRRLEKMSSINSSIIIGKVGLTVSKNNLIRMKFDEYNSIFILLEDNVENKELVKTLPPGEYACIYYRGNHSHARKYYEILLDYIKQHGYSISGDSIERTIIDQFISKEKEHYLTEIQIPVQK